MKSKEICQTCGKDFFAPKSRNRKYCSSICSKVADTKRFIEQNKAQRGKTYEELYGEEKAKERKQKVSIQMAKPLADRGWSEEKLAKLKESLTVRNKKNIGKTYEELYGEEKAKEIKQLFTEQRNGDNNGMSLKSIAERNNCSLEEASKLTPAKGRFKELHPMFGKHHSVESKISIMNTFNNGANRDYIFSNGYFDNIYWQGTWELYFLIGNIEKGNKIKRFDSTPIYYEDENRKPHHYFPDYIINEEIIIELKGNESRKNTIEKKEAAVKLYGDRYVFINNIKIGMLAKNYLRMMKEKYGDRLIINHNPHEKNNDSN